MNFSDGCGHVNTKIFISLVTLMKKTALKRENERPEEQVNVIS